MPSLPDLIKVNDQNLADVEFTDVFNKAPLLAAAESVGSSNGTQHKYLVEDGAPTVGFRAPNTGRDNASGSDRVVTTDLKIVDASFDIDFALANAYKDGPEAYINREARRFLRAGLFGAESAVVNGDAGDGFNGLAIELDAATHNAMLTATRAVLQGTVATPPVAPGLGGLGGSGGLATPNTVLVRNDSGAEVPRFGVLGVGGPIIDPADNEAEFLQGVTVAGGVDLHTLADQTEQLRNAVSERRTAAIGHPPLAPVGDSLQAVPWGGWQNAAMFGAAHHFVDTVKTPGADFAGSTDTILGGYEAFNLPNPYFWTNQTIWTAAGIPNGFSRKKPWDTSELWSAPEGTLAWNIDQNGGTRVMRKSGSQWVDDAAQTPDMRELNGTASAGDYIGPWLWNELKAVLELMTHTMRGINAISITRVDDQRGSAGLPNDQFTSKTAAVDAAIAAASHTVSQAAGTYDVWVSRKSNNANSDELWSAFFDNSKATASAINAGSPVPSTKTLWGMFEPVPQDVTGDGDTAKYTFVPEKVGAAGASPGAVAMIGSPSPSSVSFGPDSAIPPAGDFPTPPSPNPGRSAAAYEVAQIKLFSMAMTVEWDFNQ